MSMYTSIALLQKRIKPIVLAELADDVNTPADITAALTIAVIDQAIADASAMIDGYLLGHTDMTDPIVQTAIEQHAATLTLYSLYRRRYATEETNPLSAARKDSLAWLTMLAKGTIKVTASPQSPSSPIISTAGEVIRTFGRENLKDF